VHIFRSDGVFVADRDTRTTVSAGSIAVDAAFNVYVSTKLVGNPTSVDRLVKINRLGAITATIEGLGVGTSAPGLHAIAVDSQTQRVYFSDGGPISPVAVYSLDFDLLGNFGSTTGPLGFVPPAGLATNALGFVYVVDRGHDRIMKVVDKPTLTINLVGVDPAVTTGATFSASGPTPIPAFTIDDNPNTPTPSSRANPNLLPGTYTVSAPASVGSFQLNTVTCSNGQTGSGSGGSSLPVVVIASQTVTCDYYYEWIG